MTTDIKELAARLRGFAARHYNAERVRMASDAADALEALAGEVARLTSDVDALGGNLEKVVAERDRLADEVRSNRNLARKAFNMAVAARKERNRLVAAMGKLAGFEHATDEKIAIAREAGGGAFQPDFSQPHPSDAAPAVCVWKLADPDVVESGCGQPYSAEVMRDICPSCGKPIKFKEAK
jgi:hypothetical protein